MYLLFMGASILAAVLLRGSGLFVPAVINAVANVWSLGVMVNFRDDPVWPRNNYDRVVGGAGMLSSGVGIVLLIVAFVR